MSTSLRTLMVEDSENDALLILRELRRGGYDVVWERVETPETMRAALDRQPWDIVISDFKMPQFNGMNALKLLKASGQDLPFILVSGTVGEELAVEAMKAGASDYLMKGKLSRLVPAVERELRDAAERRERKRVEETFRALSARHEAILAAVPDMIMEVDNRKVYTWANPAGLAFFGADVIGKEAAFYFASEQTTYDSVRPLFDRGQDKVYVQSWQRRHDGEKRLLAWWCRALKDGNGSVIGALSSGRDITEIKRVEEALRLEQSLFTSLISTIPDHIYFKNRQSRFIRINNTMARLFRLSSPGEAVGKSDFDFFTDEHARQAFDDEQRAMSTGEPIIGLEEKETWPDGRITWVSTSKVPLCDANGCLTGLVGISRDITDRKQAEETLHASQQQFQAVFEQAAVGMVIADGDEFRILKVNHRFCEILGYSAEELLGLTSRDITHPDDIPTDVEQAKKIGAGTVQGSSWEKRYRKKDGTTVWTRAFVALLDPTDGSRRLRIGVIEDITERKLAEQKYQSIFDNAVDGIFQSTPEGRLLVANAAMAHIFGYASPDELMGDRTDLARQGYADPARREEFKRLMEERGAFDGFEFEALHKDGRKIWVSENVRTVRDAGGRVVCYEGTLQDITERKNASDRVREQAALLDTTSDAIYLTALDGTIRSWNKGSEQIYGWSAAEALDRKTTELLSIPGGDTADPLAAVLQEGDWSGERRHKTKTGREVVVFARLALVRDAAGQPVSVFTIDTDITEKKQLEARFLQAQRLENLGALASGIAHDLNNVLAPIIMASEILRSKAQTDSERNMLATMEACARRGAHIIRQVLTFARGIEGKRIALQPRHLLSEIAEIAGETFPKNIELETDVAKDLWPVIGDVTQLHQVVMNLCVNARDAMKEGGRLGISAENADLDETFALMTPGAKSGPYVHLSISDTGTGIPPEHFDKIFDPFYTTKAPGKGTGLGLSTVLGIVKSHGGFIQFKSQLGKGTCFEVYLPATPDAKPVARPSCAPTPRGNGELILVVDDEISIRTVATKILEVSGYKVVSAAEGTEALAVFMQNRAAIAAVVTDMLMPGMDGPDLIRVLRRIDPQIRIIGISGMGDSTPAGGVESLAMSALLTKPFTGASLLFALHAVLQAPPGAKVDASTSPWRGVSAAPWGPASGSAGNSRRQSPTGEIAGQRPAPPGGTAVSPDPASGDGTPATDQTHL